MHGSVVSSRIGVVKSSVGKGAWETYLGNCFLVNAGGCSVGRDSPSSGNDGNGGADAQRHRTG